MKHLIIILSLGFLFSACLDNTPVNSKDTKQGVKQVKKKISDGHEIIDAGSLTQYTGKPGQIIVVAENTEYTQEIAHLLDSIFEAPIRPYYPPTPYFSVYHRTPTDYNRLSKGFRNVIDFKIDDSIESGNPVMTIYENYYARTQLYIKIRANNMVDLVSIFEKEVDYLFKLFDRQEWKREYLRHLKYANESTREKLKTKFGIDLVLPGKFRYESIDNTYAILIFPERSRPMELELGSGKASKVNFIQSGLMIWQYPYTDTSQLNPNNLIKMRDTILKKYALHEMEGVYMGTQYHPAALPVYEPLKIGEVQGYQFRGLYKFTGEAEPSGGRFWSFHFKHPYRNRIVAISGYLDVPPTMKANLDINIIRSIIYSLKVEED